MVPVSYVTIIWSTAAAAALLLGFVHGVAWILDRRAWANLTFSVIAVSVAAIAWTELGMMYALTPEDWGEWLRWCHLPIFFATAGIVLFVRLYFGVGRSWLAATIIGLRCAVLLLNSISEPNFNFARIDSLDRIELLGEEISIVGEAVTGRSQWLASTASLLLILFVFDAMLTLWRTGASDARRKAVVIGGSILTFVMFPTLLTQLMIWNVIRVPVIISLPFVIVLGAMAIELSLDTLRARRLVRELSESEQRLELAASAAGLGLCIWDVRHNLMWTTERARHLLGLSGNEAFAAERWLARIHPQDVDGMRRAMEDALAAGGEYSIESRVCLPEGGTRWIAAHGRAQKDLRDQPALIRGVVRDVTERRRVLEEREELQSDLAQAGRVTLLGQLASALAHELSQPLTAMLANLEVAKLILRQASPDVQELRGIILDSYSDTHRSADVIEHLRTLLQRRPLDFKTMAIEGLLQEAISLVRNAAIARQVTLECSVAAGLPKIVGDRVHLSQVLLNLIMNGMDAMTVRGGLKRSVTVSARQSEVRMIEVAVSDCGAGIPPEAIARIFEPFFTTKPAGMGMGLAVSRTIIEAHGGRLWAENNKEGGATFRFTVSVAEAKYLEFADAHAVIATHTTMQG